MPLSGEELRLLEQMERALVEDDPKLASTLRGTTMRRTARRRVLVAGLAFAVGVAVLMTGAVTSLWYVGVAGFVIMLASATIALGALPGRNATDPRTTEHASGFSVVDGGKSGRGRRPKAQQRKRNRGSSGGSFMERMEERWRRRREDNGGF